MSEESKISNGVEEIEMLKQRIAELEAISGEKKEGPEIVKEAIKEHLEKNELPEEKKMPIAEIRQEAQRIESLKTKEEAEPHQRQVSELLQMVETKGLINTVAVVKDLNDPHLEDDFHDALIQYLQNFKNV